jgi:hypothetical protein
MKVNPHFAHEYAKTPNTDMWDYVNKYCERTGMSHIRLILMGIGVLEGRFILNPELRSNSDTRASREAP